MLSEDVKGFFVLGWDQLNFHCVEVDMNGPLQNTCLHSKE